MLAKVVKQQHAGRPTLEGTMLKPEMTEEGGTKGTSWMSKAAGQPKSGTRKVSNSREDSNIQKGHKQQQQALTTKTLATAAGALETSLTSTAEGRPAIVEMPKTVY
jgi:hypothetical protein